MPRSPADRYRRKLEKAKAGSTGQLMLKSARLLNELAVARVRRLTGEQLRPSHTGIFPHLELEGTRLTMLAERLGITKQAASELVGDLEAMRIVERVPDPADGRARLIRFSQRGREGLLHGASVMERIERELATRIGDRQIQGLHGTLARIVPALDELLVQETRKSRP